MAFSCSWAKVFTTMVGLSSATAAAIHSVDSRQTVRSTASSFFMGFFLLLFLQSVFPLNIPLSA